MDKAAWIERLIGTATRNCWRGGMVVVLPEYRPDQCLALAHAMGLPLFDYRGEIMAPLGWDAARLSLSELDATVRQQAVAGGAVLSNVDALLATKAPSEREQWIRRFLAASLPNLVVVPIVVHTQCVPKAHERTGWVPDDALPAQGIVTRLAF